VTSSPQHPTWLSRFTGRQVRFMDRRTPWQQAILGWAQPCRKVRLTIQAMPGKAIGAQPQEELLRAVTPMGVVTRGEERQFDQQFGSRLEEAQEVAQEVA